MTITDNIETIVPEHQFATALSEIVWIMSNDDNRMFNICNVGHQAIDTKQEQRNIFEC